MGGKNKRSEPKALDSKPTALQETFYANLLFWAFLAVLAILTYAFTGAVWDDIMIQTIKFIFLVFGGGFTLVSVLDLLYDRYVAGESRPDLSERP
jgi:hypothetical protein